MQIFSSVILLASAASTTLAWSHLFERAPPGCLADNCLRAITGTQPGQTQTRVDRAADCSSFLAYTVTPSTTVTVTATASFSASETLSFTTTITTTATSSAEQVTLKRSVLPADQSVLPAYASPCTSSPRYSSACSCAGWLPTTVTASIPTVTTTISTTAIVTTVDVVSTMTTTDIVSAPSSVSNVGATCEYTSITIYGTALDWVQIFVGSGVSETTDNPSVGGMSAVTTTYPGSMSACDAATACTTFAWNSKEWVCLAYYDNLSTASDYSVANSDIGVSMGYQIVYDV